MFMLEHTETNLSQASLQGKAILLTAPQDSAERMAEWVQQRGGQALLAPLIERVPLPIAGQHAQILDRLADYRWIVFTSGGAVERFFDEIEDRGVAGGLANSIIVAIGARTRWRIEQRGPVKTVPRVSLPPSWRMGLPKTIAYFFPAPIMRASIFSRSCSVAAHASRCCRSTR
jgi:hypothetical protein